MTWKNNFHRTYFFRSPNSTATQAIVNIVVALILILGLSYTNLSYGLPTPSAPTLPLGWKMVSMRSGVDSKVLAFALKAYNTAKSKGHSKKNILTVVDYSLPATKKRMWVFDVARKKLLFHTLVAHGQGSGKVYAKSFSNQPRTKKSSLGVFRTGVTYIGKHGESLNLHGLEQGVNSNAFRRGIVMHNANYVNEQFARKHGYLGRSWGCLALDKKVCQPVINTIKNGTLVFAYYPDKQWLASSKYLNVKAPAPARQQAAAKQLQTDYRRT